MNSVILSFFHVTGDKDHGVLLQLHDGFGGQLKGERMVVCLV